MSVDGSPLRAVALGAGDGVRVDGIELERYPDLATLKDAVEQGLAVPELVLVDAAELARSVGAEVVAAVDDTGASLAGGDGLAGSVHAVAGRVLGLLGAWLADEALAQARLVLMTEGAVGVAEGEAPDLAQSALVGLLRSAASEHPGRFGLVDVDGSDASWAALFGALVSEEPELSLREGSLLAPRLGRVALPAEAPAPTALDPRGTVLITGGTGSLGALLARHLVVEHGAKRLLLVSRSGGDGEGAVELVTGLEQLGCEVRVVACDVSDRTQLEELLASIP
jgi:hypothetical protein